jgi:8-oxo-dGTP diphosphatase
MSKVEYVQRCPIIEYETNVKTKSERSTNMIKTPLLTVDALIVNEEKIVLIKRKNPPYGGMFALPGGFVEIGETVEDAIVREAKEETNLDIEIIELLGVYSDPNRDPRGHTVSICFIAVGRGDIKAGDDAGDVGLFDMHNLPELAFDHNKMVEDAILMMESFGNYPSMKRD